jgi:choline transporter-like protein 2/4/5
MKAIFLLSLFHFSLIAIFYGLWVVIAGGLATAGQFEGSDLNSNEILATDGTKTINLVPQKLSYDEPLQKAIYYHSFGALWVNAFLIAMMNFMVASSFSQWYFADYKNGQRLLGNPVFNAFGLAWKKHIGTMIFGSLVVAVATTVKDMIVNVLEKVKKIKLTFIVSILECLIYCIEYCIKHISSLAYVYTAIYGYGFYDACRKLYDDVLNKHNVSRVAVVHAVGRIVVALGRSFVVLFTVGITFTLIMYVEPFKSQIEIPYLAVSLVFVISFVMSVVAFEIVGMGLDTLTVCFIIDENGGSHLTDFKEKMDKIPEM